jgi:hypothetical protein
MTIPRLFVTTAAVAVLGVSAAMAMRQDGGVQRITLPSSLTLPATGNVDAVNTWRYGRIEQALRTANSPDVTITIRTEDGNVHEIVAPAAPMDAFARASNWMSDVNQSPGRASYTERMIAFDVDQTGRLIAMISLEPMDRNNRRLRRAIPR